MQAHKIGDVESDSKPDVLLRTHGSTFGLQLEIDDVVRSLWGRHPGEPRVRSEASAGVHPAYSGIEGTGFLLVCP
jgi:hypothetical protein